jgi:hypothetical protein
MKIDFNNYYNETKLKVLSGRPNGAAYREKLNLDNEDKSTDIVSVIIPDLFFSVNSSFFLGCFGKSVRFLGENKFRQKYIFECDEVIREKCIEDGISRALNDSTL